MKPIRFLLSLLALTLLACSPGALAAEKTKVACIGDSITAGVGAKNKKEQSYPAQLQKTLGDRYEVVNFGQSGIKMTGYLKVWQKRIADFQPDIVTIKLGTNDTKGLQAGASPEDAQAFHKAFSEKAAELIGFLEGLESKPTIYVCLPVPVFQDKWGINEKAMVEAVIPALKKLAGDKGLKVIDLYTPCQGKGADVPDGVHPNEAVYTILADTIAKAITAKD